MKAGRMKDESDECFSDSSLCLHHSSLVLSPCGGTETTRACEARNPGSIPGGGIAWKRGEYRFRRTRLLNVAARSGGEGSSPSSSAWRIGDALGKPSG